MRVPIASALAWPDRMVTPCAPLDLATLGKLEFEAPDFERFLALALARAAIAEGGGRPAQLNAANEVAVAAFLSGRIGFLDIAAISARLFDATAPIAPHSLHDVFNLDRENRARAEQMVLNIDPI
jgi:1-deoxy-D-xylulose-5-phosphate reductoisomerase